MAAVLTISLNSSSVFGQDEESSLPLTKTDQVELKPGLSGKSELVNGVITDLMADTVTIRKDGARTAVLSLKDVAALRFTRSEAHDNALRAMQNHQWSEAIAAFDRAESIEQRAWVIREILGAKAECHRSRREFQECLQCVKKILSDDPASRHALALPLVWDERLPEAQRYSASPEDLRNPSVAHQLAAASALLADETSREIAASTLQKIRLDHAGAVSVMAELQLWRLRVLKPESIQPLETERWQSRLEDLDRHARAPGEFLAGRAWAHLHEHDKAIVCLLWMPLVAPMDAPTTAASLSDAIDLLKQSGRTAEADRLSVDLMTLRQSIESR